MALNASGRRNPNLPLLPNPLPLGERGQHPRPADSISRPCVNGFCKALNDRHDRLTFGFECGLIHNQPR